MDLAFSEEQEALRVSARRYLADRFPLDRVATVAESEAGWDPSCWDEVTDLGWLGAGVGMRELAAVAEETGYALFPGPYWSTVALVRPTLGGLCTTDRPGTLAWLDDEVRHLTGAISASCTARESGGTWRLSGVKRRVPEATTAELAVVLALGPDGPALWALDLDAHRDVVHPLSTVDNTRRSAELRLAGTPVEPLLPAVDTPRALSRARRAALVLLTCEAVGVTQRALDLATAHGSAGADDGRPAGAYRGVSHRLANIHTALQVTRALAGRAVSCVEEDDLVADEATATAAFSAGHAAVFACENAIHAMGGVGYTWDHPLHRLYRRAQWINAFEGFPSALRDEVLMRR